MRRVVITGMGAITPVGLSVEEFWNSVKEGRTNFAEVTRFDTTKYRAHMAAEIQKITWILNLPNVWNFSASTQWLQQKKPSSSPVLI